MYFCHPQSYGLRVTYKLIICIYVCVFLTTLLLVDTTDTGFSLVDFNEVFEIVLLVWPVQALWAGFILYTSNTSFKSTNEKAVSVVSTNNRVVRNTHTYK